jgi:HAD superfamily hydrolase (TIGR01549 family)
MNTNKSEVEELLALVREKAYRKLVFDLDETLTLLNLPWDEWINEVAGAMPPARALRFRQAIYQETEPWGPIINQQIDNDPLFYDRYLAICTAFEKKYFSHTPYDELVRALPRLKQNDCQFYLWTANIRQTAERALDEMGIAELFDRIIAREDIRHGKPDKEGWDYILRPTDRSADVLFIGDSANDEEAAAAAGVAFYKIRHFKDS